MNPCLRWGLAIIPLWAIPAFFFWVGLGFVLGNDRQHREDALRQKLAVTLESVQDAARNEAFCEALFRKHFLQVASLSPASPAFVSQRKVFKALFPGSGLRIFYFDGNARCISSTNPEEAFVAEGVIRYLRTPWEQGNLPRDREDPELQRFGLLEAAFSGGTLWTLRVFGPGRAASIGGVIGSREASSNFLLYQWAKTPDLAAVAGFLAIVNLQELPAEFPLKTALAESQTQDLGLGFWKSNAEFQPPSLLDSNTFLKLVQQQAHEPSTRFDFGPWAVQTHQGSDQKLLIGIGMRPSLPLLLLVPCFFLYGLLSLKILVRLYRIILLEETPRLSFPEKLLLFFCLGILFPMGISSGLAQRFLETRWQEIISENREQAEKQLDSLDSRYEEFLGRKELYYRQICGEGCRNPPTLDTVRKSLDREVEKGILNDYYLAGANGTLLGHNHLPVRSSRFRASLASGPEKLRQARIWLEQGELLAPGDLLVLREPGKSYPPSTRFRDESQLTMMCRAITLIGKELIGHYTALHVPTTEPHSQKFEISIETMVGPEFQSFLGAVKGSLGKLRVTDTSGDRDFHFANVVPGPDGKGAIFVLLFLSATTLEELYLEQAVKKDLEEDDSDRIKAVSIKRGLFSYPSMEVTTQYYRELAPLVARGITDFSRRRGAGDQEVEVTGLLGRFLKSFFLIHETPMRKLSQRQREYTVRAWMFVLASTLLAFLLVWLLVERLLRPLQDVSIGIRAIRNKDFSFRIPSEANDEMGRLCSAFNQTIEHLKEMEIASAIQTQLYPESSVRVGQHEICGKNQMMQAVGGDYYDYFTLPNGKMAVILGDVSGHGVSAALVTAMAKAAFTILCPLFPEQPEVVLQRINEQFFLILNRKKMMSCYLGILDPKTGILCYSNAGQCSPIFTDQDSQSKLVDHYSHPLGIVKKARYSSKVMDLTGASLLLYSDGLVEAMNDRREMLGYSGFLKRISETAQRNHSLNIEDPFVVTRGFTGSIDWIDDATALLVKPVGVEPEDPAGPRNPLPTGRK